MCVDKEGCVVQKGVSCLGVVVSGLFEDRKQENGGEGRSLRVIEKGENSQNANYGYHKRLFRWPKTGKMKKF